MMRVLNVVIITAMILGVAPFAHAGPVLVSAPLSRAGVTFGCLIANAGTTPIDVDIEILDNDGNVDLGPSQFTIAPGASNGPVLFPGDGSNLLHCRYTLRKGAKSKVRAQACAYSGINLLSPCLSVAEAR